MDVPPDPALDQSCTEAAHELFLRLVVVEKDDEQSHFLRNEMSGEEVLLPGPAELHFHDHRGFLVIAGKTTWVSEWVSTSVWKTQAGREFIVFVHTDGRTRRWCSELCGQKEMTVVPLTDIEPPCQLHVWTFKTSSPATRHGRIFFELCWFLDHMGLSSDTKSIGKKWRESWLSMFNRKFDLKHWMVPFASKSAKPDHGMCCDRHALSPPATLHFLIHKKAHTLLQAVISEFVPRSVELTLQMMQRPVSLTLQNGHSVDLRELKACCLSDKGWKFPTQLVGEQATLAKVLEQAAVRQETDKLYLAILEAVSTSMLMHWQVPSSSGSSVTRLQAKMTRQQTRQEIDASDKLTTKRSATDLSELPSTSTKRARHSKLNDTHTAHDRYQYFLAGRRAMLNCPHVCIADDDTTIGGKHRQMSALLNLETGEALWGQPLAPWSLKLAFFSLCLQFFWHPRKDSLPGFKTFG